MSGPERSTHSLQLEGMAPLLQVYDMPASLYFYRDIMGFSVLSSSGTGDDVDWVLLKYEDVQLMLNTLHEQLSRPDERDQNREAVHSDITLYFGCRDIESAYQYLLTKNIDVQKPEITGYGWKAIRFSDPDGYGICFHWPVDKV